jgi:hypothetical protein
VISVVSVAKPTQLATLQHRADHDPRDDQDLHIWQSLLQPKNDQTHKSNGKRCTHYTGQYDGNAAFQNKRLHKKHNLKPFAINTGESQGNQSQEQTCFLIKQTPLLCVKFCQPFRRSLCPHCAVTA